MFLIVRTATDGGTVYWYTHEELNAWVRACTVAYDYADEIESPTERLKFFQALQASLGHPPEQVEQRKEALRLAMQIYDKVNGGTEVEVIPIDGQQCSWRVLPPEVVNDLDLSIDRCLNPSKEELEELRRERELEDSVPFMPDFTISVNPADTQ